MSRKTLESDFRLTQSELESFYQNGFVGPFPAYTPEEMVGIRNRIDTEVIHTPSDIYGFETGRDRHLDRQVIYEFITHPAIVGRLVSLLGPDIMIWRSNFFFKPAGAPETVWHQANVFKEYVEHPILEPPDPESLFQLTVWIAIDEANLDNGCVQLVPGTYRQLAPKAKTDDEIKGDGQYGVYQSGFFGYDQGRKFSFDPSTIVSMECQPGEFFIFTQRVIHGSPPNNTNQRRLAINFRAIQTNTKVYHHFLNDGKIEHYGHVFDLTKWGCILLHGQDQFQYNQMAQKPQS